MGRLTTVACLRGGVANGRHCVGQVSACRQCPSGRDREGGVHVHVGIRHVRARLFECRVRLGRLAEFGVRLGQREAGRGPQTRCDAVMLDAGERFVQEFDRAGQFPAHQIGLAEQEDQVGVGQTRERRSRSRPSAWRPSHSRRCGRSACRRGRRRRRTRIAGVPSGRTSTRGRAPGRRRPSARRPGPERRAPSPTRTTPSSRGNLRAAPNSVQRRPFRLPPGNGRTPRRHTPPPLPARRLGSATPGRRQDPRGWPPRQRACRVSRSGWRHAPSTIGARPRGRRR